MTEKKNTEATVSEEMQYEYDSIDKAIEELKAGRIILCTDDPDRENEGDMICAA